MSCSIWAYLVDLERLYHIYGSHDTALVAAIEAQLEDQIDRFNEFIDDYNYENSSLEEPVQPSVDEAMQMSIAGRMPVTAHELGAYAFALMLFCEHIGYALPTDIFTGMRSGVGFIERSFPDMRDLIFRSPPLGPIDFPRDLGIVIGHLTPTQAAAQLANRQSVQLSDDSEDRKWDEQAVRQYYDWLEQAVDKQQGIVTFFS